MPLLMLEQAYVCLFVFAASTGCLDKFDAGLLHVNTVSCDVSFHGITQTECEELLLFRFKKQLVGLQFNGNDCHLSILTTSPSNICSARITFFKKGKKTVYDCMWSKQLKGLIPTACLYFLFSVRNTFSGGQTYLFLIYTYFSPDGELFSFKNDIFSQRHKWPH